MTVPGSPELGHQRYLPEQEVLAGTVLWTFRGDSAAETTKVYVKCLQKTQKILYPETWEGREIEVWYRRYLTEDWESILMSKDSLQDRGVWQT
jgi:hypothetical protein